MNIKSFYDFYFDGDKQAFIDTQKDLERPPSLLTLKIWVDQCRQVFFEDGEYVMKWTTHYGKEKHSTKLVMMGNEKLNEIPLPSDKITPKEKKAFDRKSNHRKYKALKECAVKIPLRAYILKYYKGNNAAFCRDQVSLDGEMLRRSTVGSWIAQDRDVFSDYGYLFTEYQRKNKPPLYRIINPPS